MVSVMTVLVTLMLQVSYVPRTHDEPLAEIAIQITEAQPVEEVIGKPVRIIIPAIGVDAFIEDVGLVENGKLDVPEGRENAGWYELGPRPGKRGSAVIDGHLDIGGKPGVFWDLDRLQPGDEVIVIDEFGTSRTFRMKKGETYPVADAPMHEIFANKEAYRLNLITCAGTWREELDHYDQRLVVYAEMED